jgi:hypothetical protein
MLEVGSSSEKSVNFYQKKPLKIGKTFQTQEAILCERLYSCIDKCMAFKILASPLLHVGNMFKHLSHLDTKVAVSVWNISLSSDFSRETTVFCEQLSFQIAYQPSATYGVCEEI